MSKNLVPASILGTSILVSISIYFRFDIDFLQKLLSILGSSSIMVALVTYFYKKEQDRIGATIEQIAFFREKVIAAWDEVAAVIKRKDSKYWFSRITFNQNSLKSLQESFSRNYENQLAIFFNSTDLVLDNGILDKQIRLLNMIEEFALRVNHFKTEEHPALESMYAPLVQLVEQNAVSLFFVRDVIVGNPTYSATLALYNTWKLRVGKPNFFKNLEKEGLITRERMQEALKKQRESTSS